MPEGHTGGCGHHLRLSRSLADGGGPGLAEQGRGVLDGEGNAVDHDRVARGAGGVIDDLARLGQVVEGDGYIVHDLVARYQLLGACVDRLDRQARGLQILLGQRICLQFGDQGVGLGRVGAEGDRRRGRLGLHPERNSELVGLGLGAAITLHGYGRGVGGAYDRRWYE